MGDALDHFEFRWVYISICCRDEVGGANRGFLTGVIELAVELVNEPVESIIALGNDGDLFAEISLTDACAGEFFVDCLDLFDLFVID